MRCKRPPVGGRTRCYLHFGRYAGGSVHRDTAVPRAAKRRWLALRHALGLLHPGGKPRRTEVARSMAEQAQHDLFGAIEKLKPAIEEQRNARAGVLEPGAGGGGPGGDLVVLAGSPALAGIEGLVPAEALGQVALLGLQRLYELVSKPIDDDMDLKEKRLIGDMALGANKLLMRAADTAFRAKRDDALTKLLEQLASEKGEGL